MLGRIEKVWRNQTQSGEPYLLLAIDGQRYSLFDDNCADNLREGEIVEYDWKKSGKFRNITSIEPVNLNSQHSCPSEKDQQIVRMSCIKSASAMFSDLDVEPKQKMLYTLGAARRFERYINDGADGPQEDASYPDPLRNDHDSESTA